MKRLAHIHNNARLPPFAQEQVLQIQRRLDTCYSNLLSHASSCPSTISLNTIDELLRQFASSHQKCLFHKMNLQLRIFQDRIDEKEVYNSLVDRQLTDTKVNKKHFITTLCGFRTLSCLSLIFSEIYFVELWIFVMLNWKSFKTYSDWNSMCYASSYRNNTIELIIMWPRLI